MVLEEEIPEGRSDGSKEGRRLRRAVIGSDSDSPEESKAFNNQMVHKKEIEDVQTAKKERRLHDRHNRERSDDGDSDGPPEGDPRGVRRRLRWSAEGSRDVPDGKESGTDRLAEGTS
jgi:hypothetical protein